MNELSGSRGAGALALATLVLVSAGCGDLCRNQVLERVESPSGKHAVVIYVRECGATTGPSTNVSIVSGEARSVEGSGNVLVMKDPRSMAESPSETELRWTSPDTLRIHYFAGRSVQSRADEQDGVVVVFETYYGSPPQTTD